VVAGAICVWAILSRLSLTDPRPLHNAGSYLLAVIGGLTAIRWLGWRLLGYPLERALQLAFLGSLLVHLQLLNLAVNVLVLRFDLAGSSQTGGQPVIAKPRIVAQPDYFSPHGSSDAVSDSAPWRRELTAPAEAAYVPEQDPSLWRVPPQRRPASSADTFDTADAPADNAQADNAQADNAQAADRTIRWERAARLEAFAPRRLTNFAAATGPLLELSRSPLPLVEQRPGGRDDPAGLADLVRDRQSGSPTTATSAESIAWLAASTPVPLPEQPVGLDPLPDPDQWQRQQLQALSPTPESNAGAAIPDLEAGSANRPSERRLARSPRGFPGAVGLDASMALPRLRPASRIASSELTPGLPSTEVSAVEIPESSAASPLATDRRANAARLRVWTLGGCPLCRGFFTPAGQMYRRPPRPALSPATSRKPLLWRRTSKRSRLHFSSRTKIWPNWRAKRLGAAAWHICESSTGLSTKRLWAS
jgi:hypothetical protein